MRRCPYCAEDIPDDATRCPHCQSDLTTGPAAQAAHAAQTAQGAGHTPTVTAPSPGAAAWGGAPAPGWEQPGASAPPPGGGAVQFSHSGQRYLLGFGADYFGIWDRSAPSQPVERFPRTDDGWAQAWTRYASIEQNSQPVQAMAPYGGQYPGQYGPPQGQGQPWAQSPPAYRVQHQARTNGLAVAALVMGLLGWLLFVPAILAIVFGGVANGQIRNSRGAEAGRGLAIAGIVLGIAWIVFYVVYIAVRASEGP